MGLPFRFNSNVHAVQHHTPPVKAIPFREISSLGMGWVIPRPPQAFRRKDATLFLWNPDHPEAGFFLPGFVLQNLIGSVERRG